MKLAPIVLFVYNRPWHTQQTIEALQKNELAAESELIIFSDGAKNSEHSGSVKGVREYIAKIKGFKKIEIIESPINKGLAGSIISGVTETINKYGNIIVLEDDVITSKGFLKYMNDALSFYEEEQKVMHISGYMYPNSEKLPETFFFNVPYPGGGWATWKRVWNDFKNDAGYFYEHFEKNNTWNEFNKFGGKQLQEQLKANVDGLLKTWFIKWHGTLMLKNGLTLYPHRSLTQNIGFDNSGMNCPPTTKFDVDYLAEYVGITKIPLVELEKAKKIVRDFYAPIPARKQNLFKRVFKKGIKHLPFKRPVKNTLRKVLSRIFPELSELVNNEISFNTIKSFVNNSNIDKQTHIDAPHQIENAIINKYTYITRNAYISNATIGKFCSIGPNFLCGWGIHPTNGISTSPLFYAKNTLFGFSFSNENKTEERKPITIGNDVFIGANVTVMDGITIGDGAVIGAGAVVSKDIPPFSIAVGCPINVVKYRYDDEKIKKLLNLQWWNFEEKDLKKVEKHFFNVEDFIAEFSDRGIK